jgi:hypothetical protein
MCCLGFRSWRYNFHKLKKHPVLYQHYSAIVNSKGPDPFPLCPSHLFDKTSVVSLESPPPHIHTRREEKRGWRGEMRGRAWSSIATIFVPHLKPVQVLFPFLFSPRSHASPRYSWWHWYVSSINIRDTQSKEVNGTSVLTTRGLGNNLRLVRPLRCKHGSARPLRHTSTLSEGHVGPSGEAGSRVGPYHNPHS